MSLPGNGKELLAGSKPARTHARSTRNPSIMDVVLMMPLETRTVWLPNHGTVCRHQWKNGNIQDTKVSSLDLHTHTDFRWDRNS